MSILYRGIINGSATVNNGITTTTRKFIYFVDQGESPLAILADEHLPKVYSKHPDNPLLICNNINCPELSEGDSVNGGKYVVICSYSNASAGIVEAVPTRTDKPWKDAPSNVRFDILERGHALTKSYKAADAQFNPSVNVENAVGDALDIEGIQSSIIVSFTYNLRDFKTEWVQRFSDTINKNTERILDISIPAMHGKIRKLSPEFIRIFNSAGDEDYHYYKISVELEISRSAFKLEPMHIGYNALDDNGKKYRIYTDGEGNYGKKADYPNGSPVDTPAKLDKNGKLLADGADAVYLEFQDKFAANWSTISLPKKKE